MSVFSSALVRAVSRHGSILAVARLLGVAPVTVYHWVAGGAGPAQAEEERYLSLLRDSETPLPPSVYVIRGIELAENKLGMAELSRRLAAPETTIRAWRLGHATIAPKKFEKLKKVLVEIGVPVFDNA